jgi:SecD/SecF fusion protein
MKNNDHFMRGIIIIGVFLLSLWSLYPSWQVHSLRGEEKQEFIKNNPKTAGKSVNFGLDLAGGTNVVVEIDKSKLKPDEAEKALDRSLAIIRNRVDQFGLSEPQISPSGDKRIVADLAGVTAEQARDLIGQTAQLEFKLVVKPTEFVDVVNSIDTHLKGRQTAVAKADTTAQADSTKSDSASTDSAAVSDAEAEKALALLGAGGAIESDTAKSDTTKADSAEANAQVANTVEELNELPFSSLLMQFGGDLAVAEANIPAVKAILARPMVQSLIPRQYQFAWGSGFESLDNGDKVKTLYLLKRRAEMDGREIASASQYRIADGLSAGKVAVNLKFKGIGPKKFANVTGNNIKRQLAIVLDGQVISAPVIQDKIATGVAQITGLEDMVEAKQLAVILEAGSLPAPMEIKQLRSVGASLGEDNIFSGLNAMLIGLALVVGFMVFYYVKSGAVAILALLLNVIIIGAVMSMFHATLTMPGIAGIILTIGMAVDANVIIFERIREELAAGRTARTAIASGYEKAYSTIIDANVTTFLTAFILYQIGSGPIRGFGLTLMIGILASLFTALTVTRHVFDVTLKDNKTNKMSIGKGLKALNEAAFQFVANSKPFVMFSVALVVASVAVIGVNGGLNFGIDFTGGHVLTVQVDEQTDVAAIRKQLEEGGVKGVKVRTLSEAGRFMVSLQNEEEGVKANEQVAKALPKAKILSEDVVGPSIGGELRADAILAVFWSLIIIIGYIWVRFGRYGLGFGLGAVVALSHDVIITLGIFTLLGYEFNATIIAAVLTIVGYSLNDTIVVFDRIRENTELIGKDTYENRVNTSINQSLSRTFITSLTTLFVVLALVFLGGSSIHEFAAAMLTGVIVGTYSSAFIASPFIVAWARKYGVKH